LLEQTVLFADSRARDKAGIKMPINNAIMAMTTNNSIKVNPLVCFMMVLLQLLESGRMAILADSGFLTAERLIKRFDPAGKPCYFLM
jgi:hypothetical protein